MGRLMEQQVGLGPIGPNLVIHLKIWGFIGKERGAWIRRQPFPYPNPPLPYQLGTLFATAEALALQHFFQCHGLHGTILAQFFCFASGGIGDNFYCPIGGKNLEGRFPDFPGRILGGKFPTGYPQIYEQTGKGKKGLTL